jgi:hypothetical protein
LAILPPEYNIRYEKYLTVWEEREAIPRILHFAEFHDGIGREQANGPGPR